MSTFLYCLTIVGCLMISVTGFFLGLAGFIKSMKLEREIKTIRSQVCDELTTTIPHIIRKQVRDSLH